MQNNRGSFELLIEHLFNVLSENVKAWNYGRSYVKRIGVLAVAGNGTNHIRDAVHSEGDVYITGEKSLYTVQFAKYLNMNLIVGSHMFTELFGVRSFANKLKEAFLSRILNG